jgi:DNA-binding transcriptional MerR regulator
VVACIVVVQSEPAPRAGSGCGALAEYRLNDLARVSGVSARNIRAYRERGLLDPPRRVGRSAYYDDYHLSQLKTINQLLRKGFSSTHIAEFFSSLRQGVDLADLLGIQRAVLGPRTEQTREAPQESRVVDIDPGCDEARKLLEYGLAEFVDGAVVLADRTMGEIVARSSEQLQYVRAILRFFESTRETIDELATEVVHALEDCVTSRFGANYIPKPEEMVELGQILQDYRALGSRVVADRLDAALQEQMVTAVSNYTAEILLSGQWESKAQRAAEPRNRH